MRSTTRAPRCSLPWRSLWPPTRRLLSAFLSSTTRYARSVASCRQRRVAHHLAQCCPSQFLPAHSSAPRLAGHLHRRRARGGRVELLSMGRGRLRARRLRARGSRPTVRARDPAAGSRAPPRVCDDRGHRCCRRGAGLLSEGDVLIARSCVSRNERTRDLRARSSRLQFSELKD